MGDRSPVHGLVVEAHAALDTLDALEEHEHFLGADATVTVLVALLGGLPDLLLVLGRSHAHREADVSVGHEELLSLELSSAILIVSLEGLLDNLLESLVVIVVPSSGVILLLVAIHLLVVVVALSPAVVASTAVVVVFVMSVVVSCITIELPPPNIS
jgi:hypothetical protein